MTDSRTPKRIVPLPLVSRLPSENSSENVRQPRKRKRLADMTSEEKAEKQLNRYVWKYVFWCACVFSINDTLEKSEIESLLRTRVIKESNTWPNWNFKSKD